MPVAWYFMVNQLATVSQAAAVIGISPSGVRRLCTEYAAQLSASATPAPGQPRRLTTLDIQKLHEVVKLKNEGLSQPTILARLEEIVFSPPAITESPQLAQAGPQQAISALAVVEALQSVVVPLQAAQQAQADRLEALERQRLRVDVVWVGVACFIAGLIVGLSVWWF